MKHLRGVGGEDVARALADKPCVCVGTVMGPRESMIRFCRTLLMLAAIPRSEIGGAFGADQAACNIALHLGLVEGEASPNYGRIATIGLTPSADLSLADGRIVNPDGGDQRDRAPVRPPPGPDGRHARTLGAGLRGARAAAGQEPVRARAQAEGIPGAASARTALRLRAGARPRRGADRPPCRRRRRRRAASSRRPRCDSPADAAGRAAASTRRWPAGGREAHAA